MHQKQSFTHRRSLTLAIGAVIASCAAGAGAEGFALEEIVVTAQKRAESLQDVPISVAAIGGEKIAEAGIQDLGELSMHMPNVQISEAGIDNNVFIRGVGSGVNLGFEKSVGMYIDGVYSGRGQMSRAPFLDMERVEVLKGPQGILFGKNTIGGAINITTAKPSSEFEGYVEATYNPEYGDTDLTGVASGPLSDELSGRLAVNYRKLDGYFEHSLTGEDIRERENKIVRGTLAWNPSSDLDILLKYENSSFDDDGRQIQVYSASAGFPDARFDDKVDIGGLPGREEYNYTDAQVASVTVNYSLGEHTLTSITAYSAYESDISDDQLLTPYFLTPGDGAIFQLYTDEEFNQISQEIRLVSPLGVEFDYIVGAYYQTTDLDVERDVRWPVGGTSDLSTDQESDSLAVFAQGTWHLTDSFRATLGARYGRENKDFNRFQSANGVPLPAAVVGTLGPVALDRSESKVTGSFNLQYDTSEDVMVYLTASTGFKGGGFDESLVRSLFPGETAEEAFEFEEETVKSVELGAKMTLAEGAANLNIALFHSKYDDLQTSVYNGFAGFNVANAGSSISQGLEIDGRWRVTEALTVGGSLSYLDAYFDEFENGACSQYHASIGICSGNVRDLSDQPLVFSPDWAANLNTEYVKSIGNNLEWRTTLDVNYTDDFFTAQDLDPNTLQDAYTKVNLRIAVGDEEGQWSLALVGKNLTDKRTSGWINDVIMSTAPGRGNTYFALTEPPRTVAIQGRYAF